MSRTNSGGWNIQFRLTQKLTFVVRHKIFKKKTFFLSSRFALPNVKVPNTSTVQINGIRKNQSNYAIATTVVILKMKRNKNVAITLQVIANTRLNTARVQYVGNKLLSQILMRQND